ncbi:Pkinase-domain-containing protein [Jackrogersella minutella]|nr:Pkinase-domain-containing protein [Jackrogersella minutella]
MAGQRGPPPQSPRPPLGDATARVANKHSTQPSKPNQPHQPQASQVNPLRAHPTNNPHASSNTGYVSKLDKRYAQNGHRVPEVSQGEDQDVRRVSQISTTSVNSYGGRRKTHVGPWELGKTLGAGSAARVRLVRHKHTSQLAAVKILSRDVNLNTQPGSIAELDKWDRSRNEYNAENRIPFTIEREVAIMKLIDHPNIVKLYDIWENHSEIYLVLEYVPCGDFYGYLDQHGRLPEAEAMFFFRQILSALEYVHSFNICHRDLKPENILVTENNQLKITDFGMSALHQGPRHMLKTSCGSPHYAAPELIGPGCYRGDKADIWSLGVILYASLVHALPFVDENIARLLAKVERGLYRMPSFVSHEAHDLISRILVSDPEKRVSSQEIWSHKLVIKYNHLDDYNSEKVHHNYRSNARYDPVPADEIDPQALRQLKSVWHTYSESQLASLLMNSERNEFKLFYWLLCNYRENRLENYGNELAHSASDYHHLRPANWKKKYTTVAFPAQNGRSMSRFTVISNVATDENGEALERTSTEGAVTIQSYDPYKSSRVMNDVVASQARITVHRNGTSSTRASRAGSIKTTNSNYSRRAKGGRNARTSSTRHGSRRSLNSIKSGEEISYRRPASRRKRGVDFSHAQKRSIDQSQTDCRPASIAGDDTTYSRDVSRPTSPIKRTKLSKSSGRGRSGTQSMADVSQVEDADDAHLNEEFRQISQSFAKDCDEAFNRVSVEPDSYLSETPLGSPLSGNIGSACTGASTPSPTTLNIQGAAQVNIHLAPWDARPLPPPPSPNGSDMHEYVTAKRAERVSSYLPELPGQSSQLNRFGPSGKIETDRRIFSAPNYSQYSAQWSKSPLPSINEVSREDSYFRDGDKLRVVSAPESPIHDPLGREGASLEYLAKQGDTIRVVYSDSRRLSKLPTPTTPGVRKEVSRDTKRNSQNVEGFSLRQQYLVDGKNVRLPKEPTAQVGENSNVAVKKKPSWFKRGSKEKDDLVAGSGQNNSEYLDRIDTNSTADSAILPAKKKKSFGFGWWRGSKDQDQLKLSLAEDDWDDYDSPAHARTSKRSSRPPYNQYWNDNAANRIIEPQRSWLARLFRVKPAVRYLCFSIPSVVVRKEITKLFNKWSRHGLKDIVVDKDHSIIFARVDKKNHLNMKELTFATEIMKVIEHGTRHALCLVRFTQERGSATTFNKVVETLESMFRSANQLVTDKATTKMMIKTLESRNKDV